MLFTHEKAASKPIFIVGNRRSGTTLLYNLLCTASGLHPQLAEIQPLTHLLEAFAWSRENYARITTDFFSSPEKFDDFELTTVRQLMREAWFASGKPARMVFKNPELSFHVETLLRMFPDAKIIGCTRDPRDQIASEVKVHQRREAANDPYKPDINVLIRDFSRYCAPIRIAHEREPDRVAVVRYEELVSKPNDELERLGRFCSMKMNPVDEKREWEDSRGLLQRMKGRPSFSDLYGMPVTDQRIGSYPEVLTRDQVRLVESALGPLMQSSGYELTEH